MFRGYVPHDNPVCLSPRDHCGHARMRAVRRVMLLACGPVVCLAVASTAVNDASVLLMPSAGRRRVIPDHGCRSASTCWVGAQPHGGLGVFHGRHMRRRGLNRATGAKPPARTNTTWIGLGAAEG